MAETELTRCTPESQGMPSAAILAFVEEVNATIHELHSFMLLRHGNVLAEGWWFPYRADRPHMLFSLSKSFTSTGIGLAVTEGRLTVDDPVISFFPDDLPAEVSPNLAKMRVRHLLTMTTGHAKDTTERIRQSENWVRAFLALPVEDEPGTNFVYNSGASYMLSAIVQKVSGMKLIDYLRPRLFDPLGIENPTWETSPQGINSGGWGLKIKTEDIARFGQMYLQKGQWRGRQILPEAWVKEATSFQVPNQANQTNPDWQQGYGYQFWRCRHNAYRGDGAFGQYCIVMPDQDAVLAITSGVADMQQVLDLVWKHLLAEMKPAALPEDPAAQARLRETLAGLNLEPPHGAQASPMVSWVNGKTYHLEANLFKIETMKLIFQEDGCTFSCQTVTGEATLNCGLGVWHEGQSKLFEQLDEQAYVAASGVWEAEDTFVITARLYETPFFQTLRFHFDNDQVTVHIAQNVAMEAESTPPVLTGKRVASSVD